MHVSVAGLGAAMTASAACSPASFTEGVLALQIMQRCTPCCRSVEKSGMRVAVAGVGAAMTASAACSPASFTDGVLALQVAAVITLLISSAGRHAACMFQWLAWVLP
jgi:hypothetical protein